MKSHFTDAYIFTLIGIFVFLTFSFRLVKGLRMSSPLSQEDKRCEVVITMLQPLLGFEALCNPCGEVSILVDRLITIQQIKVTQNND